jgi:hypothetical protein
VLLRGLDAYLRELRRLDRRVTSAALPPWAEEEIAARAAPEAMREAISVDVTPTGKEDR